MSFGGTFGITPAGFVGKQIQDITSDLQAAIKAAFGASVNVQAQSRFGQIIGIMAERYLELWNLAEAVHASFNPDDATGIDLVNVAAITGTQPIVQTPSLVTETMTGTPGTVLPTGRQVNVQVSLSPFFTTAPGTITAVPAWAPTTAYALGARVTNGGNVYQATQAGTSAGSGGPAGTGAAIGDNTVIWEYLGAGTGAIDIPMASQANGQIIAAAGTLTLIQTPVTGWANAVNLKDATLGQGAETTAQFRIRREQELHGPGKAAQPAVLAALTKLAGVTAASVFENNTDAVDADGRPPHSVECIVTGATDAAVAAVIFQNIAAGIQAVGIGGGAVTVALVDSQGNPQSVSFTRPTAVPIYIIASLTAFTPQASVTMDEDAEGALVTWVNALGSGYSVRAAGIVGQLMDLPGALDASALLGTAPNPATSATIAITKRQFATLALANVEVNVTYTNAED